MAYTPPSGNAVNFVFVNGGYIPPSGNSVNFVFGGSVPPPPPGSTALPTALRLARVNKTKQGWIRPRFFAVIGLSPAVIFPHGPRILYTRKHKERWIKPRSFSIAPVAPIPVSARLRNTWKFKHKDSFSPIIRKSMIVKITRKRKLQTFTIT